MARFICIAPIAFICLSAASTITEARITSNNGYDLDETTKKNRSARSGLRLMRSEAKDSSNEEEVAPKKKRSGRSGMRLMRSEAKDSSNEEEVRTRESARSGLRLMRSGEEKGS